MPSPGGAKNWYKVKSLSYDKLDKLIEHFIKHEFIMFCVNFDLNKSSNNDTKSSMMVSTSTLNSSCAQFP